MSEGMKARIAELLHYPLCWDTAAYPTAFDAMIEAAGAAGCSTCAEQPALVAFYSRKLEWKNRQSEMVIKVTKSPHPEYGFTVPFYSSLDTLPDQSAEIDRLKAELSTSPLKRLQTVTAERDALREQVAELEAQQAVLVEALEEYLSKNDPEGFGCACTPEPYRAVLAST